MLIMAKITINADTDTDELQVSVNGQDIVDVNSIAIYLCPSWDNPGVMDLNVNIMTVNKDRESGIKTSTTLVAADTSEGKSLRQSGAKLSTDKSFVKLINSNKIELDILEQFNLMKRGGRA